MCLFTSLFLCIKTFCISIIWTESLCTCVQVELFVSWCYLQWVDIEVIFPHTERFPVFPEWTMLPPPPSSSSVHNICEDRTSEKRAAREPMWPLGCWTSAQRERQCVHSSRCGWIRGLCRGEGLLTLFFIVKHKPSPEQLLELKSLLLSLRGRKQARQHLFIPRSVLLHACLCVYASLYL